MISIQKSLPAPAPLTTDGAVHRAAMERAYDLNPAACLAPKSTLIQAQSRIYGNPAVKRTLKNDQYDKCCYCESNFVANYHGDVEHFRPKAGYQQDYGGSLEKPGYYWLAYEWSNLYFACALCNQTYKGNFFPLANHPAGRANGRTRAIATEQANLLDLATENPETHVTFHNDVVKARKLKGKRSARGKACITAYGLDNLDLTDKRREFLERLISDCILAALDFSAVEEDDLETQKLILKLYALHKTLDKVVEHVEKVRKRVHLAAQDSAEFAGMVRAFIRRNSDYADLIAQPDPALAAAAWKRARRP